MNLMAAGPIVTTQIAGKMQKTSGNTIFTPVLAAASSARWRRLVRTCPSARAATARRWCRTCRSGPASLTSETMSSTPVRSARLCSASDRALPARSSRLIRRSSPQRSGCANASSALTRWIAWSRPRPASTLTTSRSSASGSAQANLVLARLRHPGQRHAGQDVSEPGRGQRHRQARPGDDAEDEQREQEQRDADPDPVEDDERLAAPVPCFDQPLLQLAGLRDRLRRHRAQALEPVQYSLAVSGPFGGTAGGVDDFAEPLLDRGRGVRRERHGRRGHQERGEDECQKRKQDRHVRPRS